MPKKSYYDVEGSPDKVPGKYAKKGATERVMTAHREAKVIGGSVTKQKPNESSIAKMNELQNQNKMAKKLSKGAAGKGMRVLKDGIFPKEF